MNKKEQFKQDLIALCKKHGLVAVPTYDLKPSAHDPLTIVPLDEFWLEFIEKRYIETP